MKVSKKALMSIICISLAIVGCSNKSDKSEGSNSGNVASNNSSDDTSHPKDMLRIALGDEIPTFDPQKGDDTVSTRVAYDLFEGLVSFDKQNRPMPGLAEKWDISPDGKTYTFHLRKDLKFSDGSPITAKDFVYTYQRLGDPKTASTYNFLIDTIINGQAIIDGKMPANTLGVSAPDDLTFVAKLTHADPAFLTKCNMPNLSVVPQEVIKKYGDQWTNAGNIVTSGAYKVKEHVVKGYILIEKNSNYYDAKDVAIQYVKFYPYSDIPASMAAYKSGGLDLTFQTVPVDQYKQIKKDYPTELHTIKQEALYYYDLNMQLPEIKNNPKLRQALSMAVDRAVVASEVLGAGEAPIYSDITPTVEQGKYASVKYDWADLPRDQQIAKAQELFKEAGYGPQHPLVIAISYNTNDQHKKVALAISSMWSNVFGNGIKVSSNNQEWKTFIAARNKGDYQIARDGWVADYDSVTSYTQLYICNSGANKAHYCNPKYDALVNQATIEKDSAKQETLYKQALQLALNDYNIIPIFQYTYQRMVKPYVKGYDIDQNYLDHTMSKWVTFSDVK